MKLTFFLTIAFLLNAMCSDAQDLIISGKVSHPYDEKANKVYYTEPGEKFNSKKVLLLTPDNNFTFKLSLKKIQEDSIVSVFFAIDSTANITAKYGCYQKVNVHEIVQSDLFKGKKQIKLKCDLLFNDICTQTAGHSAKWSDDQRFIGNYTLRSRDTIHTLKLTESYYMSSKLDKLTGDYMDKETGEWEYDEAKKHLVLTIQRQSNGLFGIIISKIFKYEFEVVEEESSLIFKNSAGVTLEKNEGIPVESSTNIVEDVDEEASFPGGITALKQFIKTNMQYPERAIEENIEGKCFFNVVVDNEGNMSTIKMLKGIPNCKECDYEALRIVEWMTELKWIPAKVNGKNVTSRYQFLIPFVLD